MVEPGEFRTDFSGRSLKQSRTVIADYAETAGRRRIENDTTDGHQIGDPQRSTALSRLSKHNPPSLLLLGSDAVRIVKGRLMKFVLKWKLGKRTALLQISRLKQVIDK